MKPSARPISARTSQSQTPGRQTSSAQTVSNSGKPSLSLLAGQTSVADFLKRSEHTVPSEASSSAHSLLRAFQLPNSFSPEVLDVVLKRFTRAGEKVLDPFCGTGLSGLYAQLQGRVAWMSDIHPIAVRMTSALLNPVGLDEVVLRIHQLPRIRPTNLNEFTESFGPFFHPNTFVELNHLRRIILESRHPVDRFLGLLAATRLHGHTKSYFSSYTSPVFALPPEKQHEVNLRRRCQPEYRALAPRLIKRAAELLEEGVPARFYESLAEQRVFQADAAQLQLVPSNSVDLYLASPPLPGEPCFFSQQWLTRWFLGGVSPEGIVDFPQRFSEARSLDAWKDFLSRILREGLRVVRPGGFLTLQLGKYRENADDSDILLEDLVAEIAENVRFSGKRFKIHEMLVLKVSRSRPEGEGMKNAFLREPRVLALRVQNYA